MKKIILLLFIIATTYSFCQDTFEFKKYVNDGMIGQKQTKIDQDSTVYETTYLGKVNMKEGSMHTSSITYHVLSQFYSVQAAIVRHGHSRIIFLNEDGETVRIYTLSLPDELPIAITNNGITFANGTIRYVSLPPLFCIPEGGCYE